MTRSHAHKKEASAHTAAKALGEFHMYHLVTFLVQRVLLSLASGGVFGHANESRSLRALISSPNRTRPAEEEWTRFRKLGLSQRGTFTSVRVHTSILCHHPCAPRNRLRTPH